MAAYLIPQVMAYAEVAGLLRLLGSGRSSDRRSCMPSSAPPANSPRPESTTALMTASVLAPLAVGDPARYAVLAAALGLIVGALCVIGWLARLGFLADLLSKPVLVGYMAGIAVVMIVVS